MIEFEMGKFVHRKNIGPSTGSGTLAFSLQKYKKCIFATNL
jgi:hypothetical protein